MAGRKGEHLSEAIRRKLGTILIREARDPRFQGVTITEVMLSKDRSFAKVGFSCFEPQTDRADLESSLNRAAGFFSQVLSRTLATRHTPKLHFYYDPGFDYALEMDHLLAGTRNHEE